MTHDMFNQPLSNALAGTIDPLTGKDACRSARRGPVRFLHRSALHRACRRTASRPDDAADHDPRSDPDRHHRPNRDLSEVRSGRHDAVAAGRPGRHRLPDAGTLRRHRTPAADRIARGEEWLQTNTLDGQKAHDSFARIGEPSYFQEFGPAGYHVSIGFANPAIINARLKSVCNGTNANVTGNNCTNTLTASSRASA